MTHDIHLHHITRIEGHGNLVLNITKGEIEELRLEIVESPRFFEVMLKGRRFEEAPAITSRICGICAISHTTASVKACEAALGVTPSDETVLLRKLLVNAELLQSHILHVYLLVAPDFFGVGSVIPMAESHPDVVKRALRLKRVANEVCRVLVGRHVHPVGFDIGGFAKWPGRGELDEIKVLLESAVKDMEDTVSLFEEIEIPPFERSTQYISLGEGGEYALYDGQLTTEGRTPLEAARYKELITEEVVEYSTAKQARSGDGSIMVGALARVRNGYELLRPEAQAAAERLGLDACCVNPFMNNVAQVVECVHAVHDSLRIVERLSPSSNGGGKAAVEVKAGRGVGAVEAPRGTLYHDYEIDDKGIIQGVNCIIPTAQNLANIEGDIRAIVPSLLDLPKDAIEERLEMLVRAYDPCISCSAHLLKVKFVQ